MCAWTEVQKTARRATQNKKQKPLSWEHNKKAENMLKDVEKND
ncbi:MAG: hypothetical protein [Arizlama microvirus]|nr:MAG: hypothetical protein [Arizlama microvirus]